MQKLHRSFSKTVGFKYIAIHNALKREFNGDCKLLPSESLSDLVASLQRRIDNTISTSSKEYKREYSQLFSLHPFSICCSSLEHQVVMKKIRNLAENEIRAELGYKEIRKENVHEKILLNIVYIHHLKSYTEQDQLFWVAWN